MSLTPRYFALSTTPLLPWRGRGGRRQRKREGWVVNVLIWGEGQGGRCCRPGILEVVLRIRQLSGVLDLPHRSGSLGVLEAVAAGGAAVVLVPSVVLAVVEVSPTIARVSTTTTEALSTTLVAPGAAVRAAATAAALVVAKTALKLGLDPVAVGGARDEGKDGITQDGQEVGRRVVYTALNHVVSVGILHQQLQRLIRRHLGDESLTNLVRAGLEATLNNVGRELVDGELTDTAGDSASDKLRAHGVVLDCVLHSVVAVGVGDQMSGTVHQLTLQLRPEAPRTVAQPLHGDTATLVSGNHHHVPTHAVVQWRSLLCRQPSRHLLKQLPTAHTGADANDTGADRIHQHRHT
eukprot:Hpha_TRINITY_DN15870_c3_g8::TRINITY_DN15870_c3_g8_i1::g.187439::m.187439